MPTRSLYQFPISHYCEKARWCLDYKGLKVQLHDLLPGPHILQAQYMTGERTVPILHDGERYIADSTAIALYLEQTCPEPRLLPAEAAARAQVLALEERFDSLGEDVRRWVYHYVIELPDFGRIFYGSYALPTRWVGYGMTPALRRILPRVYRINPRSVVASHQRMLEGLQQLEADLGQDPAGYLVGGRFSLADLTAAALYAPLIGPPGSPWANLEEAVEIAELRRQLRPTVAGQWIMRIYREHRRSSPPVR